MNDAALDRLFLRFRDRRDGRALAKLFDVTAPELMRVGVHLVRDVNRAEDLLQNTFRIAIERAGSSSSQTSWRIRRRLGLEMARSAVSMADSLPSVLSNVALS